MGAPGDYISHVHDVEVGGYSLNVHMQPQPREEREAHDLRRPLATLLMLTARTLAAALLAVALWMFYASVPPPAPDREGAALVKVTEGMNARDVARTLHSAGLIRDPLYFLGVTRLMGSETKLQAGTYAVPPGESPFGILRRLVEGEVAVRRITIPEGYTVRDIAALLAREGLVDEERFAALALGGYSMELGGMELQSLEGYLFPDTYTVPLGASEEQIINVMVDRFRQLIVPLVGEGAHGLSLHEVVTLASIVEREAAVASERPLIAGVYLNRLRINMPLQADPTVVYALGRHVERVYYADLEIDSPYNTYLYPGLPPGPIANPGLDAIVSVLYPVPSEYLYFVAKGDGTHHFSRDYASHKAAVERYRR